MILCRVSVVTGAEMAKRRLTDRFVRSLRPAPRGKRIEHYDTVVQCFGVRVTDRGHKTYVLYLRWPGSRVPTRREVANADRLELAKARKRAKEWLALVELGIDPGEKARAEQREKEQRERHTFAAVAEAWFSEAIHHQRKAAEVQADVRREFVTRWGTRPIMDITDQDIADVVAAKGAVHPAQARNLLGYAKRLFRWAVGRRSFGIAHSPAVLLRAQDLIAQKKEPRLRVLKDHEIRAVWEAAEEMDDLYGPLIMLLLLTGQRRSEVADAVWSEFDLEYKMWTIPAARMKMGVEHEVPLSDDAIKVLEGLPRQDGGDCLFSTSGGASPPNGFSAAKRRMDALLRDGLGDGQSEMPHWIFHDLRRTVRTRLSALPIPENVRELVIGHAKQGMLAVYDQHEYRGEKKRALDLWAARLRGIVSPPDDTVNVVTLRR
jgi:integrase